MQSVDMDQATYNIKSSIEFINRVYVNEKNGNVLKGTRRLEGTIEAKHFVQSLISEAVEQPVDHDINSYEMKLPPFYDEKLFKRAQQFFNDNIFAMFAGKLLGLIAVLAIPSILKILDYTKESGTSMKAYRRYLATIYHTVAWYQVELKPGSKSWNSLAAVRKRHVISSKYAERGQSGFISQKDMVFTQFGFLGFIAIRPEILGIQATDETLEAFVHFWRVIGYMIGIDDKYNLCTDSWATTKPRLEALISDVYRPSVAISSATEKFTDMSRALVTGLWCFNPFLSYDAYIFLLKMITDCPDYDYFEKNPSNRLETQANLEKLGWYDRVILYLMTLAHSCWLNIMVLRWYFNSQIHLSLVIIHYFPFLAIFKFGIRDSYVRILKGDKS